MSRAFVRESEGGEAFEDLPDRPVSPHNLVTPSGLARMEEEIETLNRRLAQGQAEDDKAEIARVSRDLRYWTHRRITAEVAPVPADASHVRFGSQVTFERDDGRRQTYVSPLAQALMGKEIGDVIPVGQGEAEIVEIAP